MSQVKLTLRPPPNVDFVHGFPGIPPAGDRPQASVKGAVEVRVGQQGVKAKWVRVELRKVETLPGGTPNTFMDYVGPSPVTLWQASEEYGILQTQDFPFVIRIPESIPPSIALENRGGIKYELVGAVCTMGKKGLLRKRKSTVVSTVAPIVIDKHELHSTWPVYCQFERRQHSQEGVNLIAERTRACYGPGDRVTVTAILRSDSLQTVILRGFELTLRETTIFRMGPFSTGKKSVPLVKHNIIGENKFPVNATLYGGTEHRAELFCEISQQRHITTTINSARHIDITYVLSVKALMGTGTHLILDLPIIVSNWPRNVSVDAIKRIGPAMSLSLLGNGAPEPSRPSLSTVAQLPASKDSAYPFPPNRPNTTTTVVQPYTLPQSRPPGPGSFNAPSTTGTTASSAINPMSKVNDFGGVFTRPGVKSNDPGFAPTTKQNQLPAQKPIPAEAKPPLEDILPKSRPVRPVVNPTSRLTVTNLPDEPEVPQVKASPHAKHNPASSSGGSSPWPTAEEEKKRLYEKARADVERVQGSLARGASASASVPSSPPKLALSPPKPVAETRPTATSRPTWNSPWPTAEEEKLRLFNAAQATAKKTQALTQTSSLHARSGSDGVGRSVSAVASKPGGSSSVTPFTAYSSPTKDVGGSSSSANRNNTSTPAPKYSAMDAGGSSSSSSRPAVTPQYPAKVPQYPTAEEEKAALKRYHEAKIAVDRTQGLGPGDGPSPQEPVSYDTLYPSAPSSSRPVATTTSNNDLPPPFDATAGSVLPEKERLRRAYDALDAAALARQATTSPGSSNYGNVSPPAFTNGGASGSGSGSGSNALNNGRVPPHRSESQRGISGGGSRPPPAAPVASGSRVLSAAEEKAMLKAKYEAEERAANGSATPPILSASSSGGKSMNISTTPPPLAPRPPAEYIQETREEDARVSRYVQQGFTPPLDPPVNGLYKSFSPLGSPSRSP